MDDSDLSSLASLSPPPPSDHEQPSGDFGLDGSNDTQPSPSLSPVPTSEESDKRSAAASPPREPVLADNPDIAFIVMFRSRFSDAFSSKLGNLGPQDIERGVVDPVPSPQVESLLCALLGLVLNRKKPVERGHYGRALEEALLAQKSQWPRAWKGQNPLSGSRTFTSLDSAEKLTLLRTLIIWSLHSSEIVSNLLKDSYKQNRAEQDLNQPLAVQPWGADGKRLVYWLIEGQDDTSFRIYTERGRYSKAPEWRAVAGTIEEMQALSKRLREDDSPQAARRLADRIDRSIPRFEATEEKRKRREYRVARRAQFTRPEPGFSLYEGRTRGKRMRYTFEEEEDEYNTDGSARRSARNSGFATPSEPTVTASGRQVRPRLGGRYMEAGVDGAESGSRETPASAEYERSDKSEDPPAPPADENVKYFKPKGKGWKGWAIAEDTGEASGALHGYNEVDAMDEDEDEAMSSGESAGEWDGDDDASDVIKARDADDEDDDLDDDESDGDFSQEPKSLVVKLKYSVRGATNGAQRAEASKPTQPGSDAKHEEPATGPNPPNVVDKASHQLPNGFASAAQPLQTKSEAAPVPTPAPVVKLATHPSPTKTALSPPKLEAIPAVPPAVAQASASTPLTNGTGAPQQYKQQTLDGLFNRPASAVGNDASKSPLSGPPAPPVTST